MDSEHARVESTTASRENPHKVDSQIIKTHYARDCNDKILSFVIQEEPNLCLDLSSIEIGCTIEIPKDQLPENGLALKLFKSLNIEINSQLITSTKAA